VARVGARSGTMDRAFQPSRKYPRRPAKGGLVVRGLGHFAVYKVGDPDNRRHVGRHTLACTDANRRDAIICD